MPPSYRPTLADLLWAESVIATVKDGGFWIFPSTGMVFQFDHVTREVTLVNVVTRRQNEEMYNRTVIVFSYVGYTVKEAS